MGVLIYSMTMSLDGYVADADGDFDWGDPGPEGFAFVTESFRPVSTHLYGRRNYELMTYWQSAYRDAGASKLDEDFAAVWQGSDKIVYSTTLPDVSTPRTRLERSFEPEVVRQLKDEAAGDLVIAGPALAAQALRAGLVDEIAAYVAPVALGGGKRFLPDGLRLDLELLDQRRLGRNGYLRFRVQGERTGPWAS